LRLTTAREKTFLWFKQVDVKSFTIVERDSCLRLCYGRIKSKELWEMTDEAGWSILLIEVQQMGWHENDHTASLKNNP